MKDLNEIVKEGVTVVDFFATWCGPCKMLSPVLEELEEDRSDFKVVKIDIDKEEALARSYGIMSVPTLILFKDGKEVSKKVGFMPKELLSNWINENK